MRERFGVPEFEVDLSEAPHDGKLAELILYIAKRCEDYERFGAMKLTRILFYSDFLTYALDRLRDEDASAASELSRRFEGWELAEDGEDIPYEMVFVNTRPLTESEKEYGRTLAAEELDG